MRKKIFGIVVMAAVAVTVGWSISQNENKVMLSDLTLNNVEALAECEPSYGGSCWLTYSHACCIGGGLGCAPCD